MLLILHFIIIVILFYLLHVVSEYLFIPSLDKIGDKLKLSSDISGSTLMAIGSSAPELAVMIISVLRVGNHEAIGIGTIVGSALFNLFVITGVVMIIKSKAKLVWQPLIRDLLFYAVAIIMLIYSFGDGHISVLESVSFILIYVLYIFSLYYWKKIFPYKDKEKLDIAEVLEEDAGKLGNFIRRQLKKKYYLIFFISIIGIGLLSWALVDIAIVLARELGIPEFIIALTIIAMGTSIPDLLSSAIVAKQGRAGMAINNGIGSNIFDVLIGLGIPFLLMFIFQGPKNINVSAANLELAFTFLMGSLVILTLMFILTKWKTKRSMGVFLVVMYVVYLSYEIMCELGINICF